MTNTFCPIILATRNITTQDFGTSIVSSICNQGKWEVVFKGNEKVLFQCSWWDIQHNCCAIQHISQLALHAEKKQMVIK